MATHSVPFGEDPFLLELGIFPLVVDDREDLPNEENQETDDDGAYDDA